MKLKIENFTISYAMDTGTGRKSSNFMSATFRLPEPVDSDNGEFDIVRLEASKRLTMWVIQDAVVRGEISSDEARERISIIKANYDGMTQSLIKKRDQ